jgi:hypothetical protein
MIGWLTRFWLRLIQPAFHEHEPKPSLGDLGRTLLWLERHGYKPVPGYTCNY